MDLTGDPAGPPQKNGRCLCRHFHGNLRCHCHPAPLAQRERTGSGQHIDMALLAPMVAVLANQALNSWHPASTAPAGQCPSKHRAHQVFEVCDGHVIVAVGNDQPVPTILRCDPAAGVGPDPRFLTNADRVGNRQPLIEAIRLALRDFARAELLACPGARGVPCGPILPSPKPSPIADSLRAGSAWILPASKRRAA